MSKWERGLFKEQQPPLAAIFSHLEQPGLLEDPTVRVIVTDDNQAEAVRLAACASASSL